MVERWHRTLKNSISCDRYSDRQLIILLGLRAPPHLDSGLSPHQQAFGTELTLPADFACKEAEELDGVEFYKQLKKVRDGYAYPMAVHHQRDNSEASEALQKARFVLVGKEGHKPQLAESYKDPTRSNQEATTATYWKEETPWRTGLQ